MTREVCHGDNSAVSVTRCNEIGGISSCERAHDNELVCDVSTVVTVIYHGCIEADASDIIGSTGDYPGTVCTTYVEVTSVVHVVSYFESLSMSSAIDD